MVQICDTTSKYEYVLVKSFQTLLPILNLYLSCLTIGNIYNK